MMVSTRFKNKKIIAKIIIEIIAKPSLFFVISLGIAKKIHGKINITTSIIPI